MHSDWDNGATAQFFRFIPSAPAPKRADKSALGVIPTRAFRYCDALTTASAFGWYLFAPMPFSLLFDGREVFVDWQGSGGWFPLDAVQFPEFAEQFDALAPPDIRGMSPPFLSSLPEPGVVQVWTGLFAKTAPKWSILIRPCANLPPTKGFEPYEGLIETDTWFGPLFLNLRLTRTGSPIFINSDWPLAMAQPIPQIAYSAAALRLMDLVDLPDLAEGDWNAYRATVIRKSTVLRDKPGSYAIENRKRRLVERETADGNS